MSYIRSHTIDSTVLVRYIDPNTVKDARLIERMMSWLDKTEIARLARFVYEEHRHAFLVSHALTRKMLANSLDCSPQDIRFELTGRNKPVLAAPFSANSLHFNLSHTQGLAVVALAAKPLGIDTEWLGRKTVGPELALRYFTEMEQADILRQPESQQQHRFLTYWTLKEAFLKAQSWGIVDSLNGFEFELSPANQRLPDRIRLRIRHANLTPTHPWRFHHWQVTPEHLVSLAVSARLSPVNKIAISAWSPQDWT